MAKSSRGYRRVSGFGPGICQMGQETSAQARGPAARLERGSLLEREGNREIDTARGRSRERRGLVQELQTRRLARCG